MTDNQAYVRIGEFIQSHPSETYSELAARLGLTRSQVARIAKLRAIKRRPGKRSALEAAVAAIDAASQKADCAMPGEAATMPTGEPASLTPDAAQAEGPVPATPEPPPAENAAV